MLQHIDKAIQYSKIQSIMRYISIKGITGIYIQNYLKIYHGASSQHLKEISASSRLGLISIDKTW